ncbi:MAG: glycosyltransferase, partial [Patescibacteria group bacterium]
IVIPAYNEGKRMSKTLEEYLAFFKDTKVEFIIVPNNCTDDTVELAKGFIERFPGQVRVHEIPGYSGKGGAVIEGFRLSQGDLVGFVDADGSTSPQEFDKLLTSLGSNDAAILSRWKKGSKIVGGNAIREIVSLGFIVCVKILFRMPIVDTQCGAKVFKREAIFSIIDRVKIHDMAFDVELLWKLFQKGHPIIEIPSVWIDNSSDSAALSSPLRLIKNAWAMFRSILNLRFEKSYA